MQINSRNTVIQILELDIVLYSVYSDIYRICLVYSIVFWQFNANRKFNLIIYLIPYHFDLNEKLL